ncbi:MAG: glycosyl hydrolase family 18 protein, partial [Cytophagales bacterium]
MVKAYYPYYRTTQFNNVQYSKLTDVIYAFAQLSTDGSLSIMSPAVFTEVKSRTQSNGKKLWIAIGGWGLSGNFSGVAADPVKRAKFADDCLALCTSHNLEGIDIDWEFPSASDKTNFTLLLQATKTKLGSTYKLSAALGGESFVQGSCVNKGHVPGVEAAAFQYIDFFNIMSYDAPACIGHHASVDFFKKAMDGYHALGCPYEKMIPGLAFYGRCAGEETYANISASNPSGFFYSPNGTFSSWCYDSKYTIREKIDYAMCEKGAKGVMIWEITQDRNDQFSLLNVTKGKVDSCACPFADPNLGTEKSLCGVSSVSLTSGISTKSGRTFTWQKDGVNISGFVNSASANNYTANASGTYKVIINEGTCTKESSVVVSNQLPTPNLGSDINLCNPATVNLSPSNLSNFPSGTNWEWRLNSNIISGQTSTTLADVRTSGTYRLTASISGCSAKFDDLVVTSSLPTPVDGCVSSPGTVSLGITNATGGPYNWYATANSTTILHTGTNYSPNISSNSTFFVAEGAGTSGSIGGTSTLPTVSWGGFTGPNMEISFTTSVPGVKINSVDIYVQEWSNITDLGVRLASSDNTVLGTSSFVSYNNGSNGTPHKLTINTSALPQTGSAGTYKLFIVDNTPGDLLSQALRTNTLGTNMTEPSGTITLLNGSKMAMNNIQFVAGNGCSRLPVKGEISVSCGPTPIEWGVLDVVKTANGNIVTWMSLFESDASHFEVLQSINGYDFTVIGRVEALNKPNFYSFENYALPNEKIIYYQIKQVDKNGNFNLSKIMFYENSNFYQLKIYPNPTESSFHVKLESDNESISSVSVMDLAGKEIMVYSDLNTGNLYAGEGLRSGTYIVKVILKKTGTIRNEL